MKIVEVSGSHVAQAWDEDKELRKALEGVSLEMCRECHGMQAEPLTGLAEGVQKQQTETGLKDKVIYRGPAPGCGMGEPWEELSQA